MHKAGQVMRQAVHNIYVYRFDYVQVFALIRIFQFLLMIPVTSIVLKLMLRVTGFTHITEQNWQSFVTHPFVMIMICLLILLFLLFVYYEMGFLFLMAFHQQRGLRYRFLPLWQQLNRKVVYFFSVQVLFLIVYLALLMPLASFMLPLTLTQSISLPPFLTEEIMSSRAGRLAYAVVASIIVMIGIRSILTLPIFTIQPNISILRSFKQSWRFSKRGLFELVVLLAMLLTGHLLMMLGITVVATFPLYLIERLMPSAALITAGLTLAFLEMVFVVLFSLLQAMFSQVMVAITYNTPVMGKISATTHRKRRYKPLLLISGIVFLVLSMMNINSLEKSVYAPDTKIIAHRGYVAGNVENTISGLVSAANAGADLIEIDIQQTVDGEFVVFHDRTLRRLAGKNGVIANMTLSELKTLTIHQNGFSDKIASLDDCIEIAKALDVALLIELKVHGQETEDVLPKLVEKLRKYKVLDSYYVQSADGQKMTQLKKLVPNLRVGIVYALNIGPMEENVDFIALEESWVTEQLIEELKQHPTDLFVWTLNDDRSLQTFIEKNVSGVITDHPDVARELRTQQSENQYFLQRILNRLRFIF
ncbi:MULTISPECIES: glycerophosphoryl diester phosphodiesterase membrane domain-containing protein [Lysinibacillus]|uniref:glycerophosphoryl diester phosphodiesterase membrane domain-containing protein n=1 Tax=Lysinibacillus TaxID=400634 RepID=UPI001C8CCA9E|nr:MULTISPECIES: glycerophosphodiester phosphodiesterase [Lysinibacillus]MBX8946696.1 glycerophosphodiester phosphodiesterase [Lysinibacillus sp. K60]UNT53920.1 glycerophosphodiester phosphodiesterase [Lysinibacillus capsici]UUV26465.1 glycerophosphodiester phosphodiesterase [Lysinibacillus sp. FN11]UYB49345.1 glycerophosphodiester phosphodiesterase [Lysinibacillus capsici]WDU81300.1 glycerophosphodiester phosphodiesterase [Lysinibacillus sp. G01H]